MLIAGCPSCCPTNSVGALKAEIVHNYKPEFWSSIYRIRCETQTLKYNSFSLSRWLSIHKFSSKSIYVFFTYIPLIDKQTGENVPPNRQEYSSLLSATQYHLTAQTVQHCVMCNKLTSKSMEAETCMELHNNSSRPQPHLYPHTLSPSYPNPIWNPCSLILPVCNY